MKLVVFGLTVSSSWGNGHATLWRGLIRALAARGHEVTFFERDVPYYAAHRDLDSIPGGRLILYAHWSEVAGEARRRLADADVAIVTSYCPDAIRAAQAVFDHARRAISVFYDLDTPVSLARIRAGESVPYVPRDGLGDFDLVLSFTGGAALEALREHLGAKRVSPLYGHVDPALHRPCAPVAQFCADLSYLGTYAADRQDALEALFIEPARRRPDLRFVLGGSAYPPDFPWRENIWYVSHVAPADHAAFFSSSRVTLNVTRRDMAALGFCPSGRLFEAAACGSPLMSDAWPGIEDFFTPGTEILVVSNSEEATAALELSDAELGRIARAARERTLEEHTSSRRADELILRLEETRSARPHAHVPDVRGKPESAHADP